MHIFIHYPSLFNAKSKFERKLNNILSRTKTGTIYYTDDSNKLIECYFVDKSAYVLEKIDNILNYPISHAIIFSDESDEFKALESIFCDRNIVFRAIAVKITRVVNIDIEKEYRQLSKSDNYEYIGRGSYWGNPYSMYDFGDENNSREDVIAKFKYDFDRDILAKKSKVEVYKLAGKTLGCHCKPKACHGDVLADFLNSWDDGN